MARNPSESPTPEQRRLHILLVVRFLVAIAVVTALIALEGGKIFSSPEYKYAYFILLFVCVADLFYVPLFRRIRSPIAQGGIQAALDLLAVSALVYLSGGVASPFVVLYFGAVVAGAVYLSPLGALFFGGFSAGLLLGIGALIHVAPLNGWTLPLVTPEILEYHSDFQKVAGEAVLPALGLLGVAFLASRLATLSTTERVVMEEILHGMGDGVVTVGGQGNIVFINPAARELLSLPQDFSPLGKPFLVLLKAVRLKHSLDAAKVDMAGSFTAEIAPENGPHRVIHITASPVERPKGSARGLVYLLRDLTMQKRMEEAIEKAKRFQDISEMAAGIAHEIRNPLTSIRGSIQELHTSEILREDDKRLMKVIIKECDRLNRMTEDFLRFAGRQSMRVTSCDLGRILADVETTLLRRPERGSTVIRVEKEGDLRILADVEGLHQVFHNLCLNALEAMNGSGSLQVRAYAKKSLPPPPEGGKAPTAPVEGVAVNISDTGSGIPPEILERIFHPFYSTKPKGFGLGLSLVYRIVDAHGGTVKVDSRAGAGSTFEVWLPATHRGSKP